MVADYMPPEKARRSAIQDPHRIVRCSGSPDVFWRSTTTASSAPGTARGREGGEGEAVVVRFRGGVTRDRTRLVVPAWKDELRVPVEGRAGGDAHAGWRQVVRDLRTGLPQRHAYHLIYRHGLEVAPDGQTLAMGSNHRLLLGSRDAERILESAQ